MDMSPQEYQAYIKERAPKSPIWKDTALAFLIGGAICVLGQLILDGYRSLGLDKTDAGTATSVTLIFLAALTTGLNLYNSLARFAGGGHARADHGLCQLRRLARHRLQGRGLTYNRHTVGSME